MSQSWCIAYRDDGTLCREPTTMLERERGGLVCWQHNPERTNGFCWVDEDEVTITSTKEKDPHNEPTLI